MDQTRREFIFLSSTIGLASIFGAKAIAATLKENGFAAREYRGPLRDYVTDLLKRCDSGELSSIDFTKLLKIRFDQFDLKKEFSYWVEQGPNEKSDRVIFKSSNEKRRVMMLLFFIPPNSSHPPHAHHDLMSCQTLLEGKLELKQYDRIHKVGDKLKIKQTSNRIILPGQKIEMSEWNDNIHWFGSTKKPSLVLNCHASGVPGKTFELKGSKRSARYFVDPIKGEKSGDFLIVPELSREEAYGKFSNHSPRYFD